MRFQLIRRIDADQGAVGKPRSAQVAASPGHDLRVLPRSHVLNAHTVASSRREFDIAL